jgi:hypothetical protein
MVIPEYLMLSGGSRVHAEVRVEMARVGGPDWKEAKQPRDLSRLPSYL